MHAPAHCKSLRGVEAVALRKKISNQIRNRILKCMCEMTSWNKRLHFARPMVHQLVRPSATNHLILSNASENYQYPVICFSCKYFLQYRLDGADPLARRLSMRTATRESPQKHEQPQGTPPTALSQRTRSKSARAPQ